jgi:hypothetical protein
LLFAGKADLDPKPPEIASDVIKRRGDDMEKNKKPVHEHLLIHRVEFSSYFFEGQRQEQ